MITPDHKPATPAAAPFRMTTFYDAWGLPGVCLVCTPGRCFVGWVRDWVPTKKVSLAPFEAWSIWSGATEEEALAYLRDMAKIGVMPFADVDAPEVTNA